MFSEQLTGRKRVNATSAHCEDPQPSSVYVRKREMQIFETEHVDKRIRRYPCSAPLGMTCHPATAAKQRGVQRQQPGIPRCRWTLNASHRAAPVAHSTLPRFHECAAAGAPPGARRRSVRGHQLQLLDAAVRERFIGLGNEIPHPRDAIRNNSCSPAGILRRDRWPSS